MEIPYSMKDVYERRHVRMVPVRYTGRTMVWRVEARADEAELGEVRWFGRWRRYALFPAAGTAFERECLLDLAEFVDDQTKRHRALLKRERTGR